MTTETEKHRDKPVDARYLRDLATRLMNVASKEIDGGDVDRLLEIACLINSGSGVLGIKPVAIWHDGDKAAFCASTPAQQEAWNRYAQAAADAFNNDPRRDSYDSTAVFAGHDRDGKVTHWCPPKFFPEWLAEQTTPPEKHRHTNDEGYEIVGTTFDGVEVLKPAVPSKNFTSEQVRAAIEKHVGGLPDDLIREARAWSRSTIANRSSNEYPRALIRRLADALEAPEKHRRTEEVYALIEAAEAFKWSGNEAIMIANLTAALKKQAYLADKYKWQVRDTCARAEKAEAALATPPTPTTAEKP